MRLGNKIRVKRRRSVGLSTRFEVTHLLVLPLGTLQAVRLDHTVIHLNLFEFEILPGLILTSNNHLLIKLAYLELTQF